MGEVKNSFSVPLILILLGNGFVIFGTWIDYIAILTICVYKFNVSAVDVAIIGALTLLPGIVLTGLISRWVGGGAVLAWLRASLLLRVLLTVALLSASNIYIFVTIAVIRSLFSSIAAPAIAVISARTVSVDNRTRYYSLLNMINSFAKITAPALGGVVASLWQDEYALLISAGLTLVGCGVFWLMKNENANLDQDNSPPAVSPPLNTGHWHFYAVVTAIFFIALFMVNNQVPVLLRDNGFDKSALGLLISSSALGNFLYGFWRARRSASLERSSGFSGRINELLFPAFMVMVLFICMAPIFYQPFIMQLAALALLFFITGVFSAQFAISSNVYLAENFQASLGIAAGRLQAIQNSAMLLAPFVGAFVLGYTSGSFLFLLAGVVGIGGLGLVYVLARGKNL